MSGKKKPQDWAEAKRRCRLNEEDIRMAKELGMAPRSLLKNIPSPNQRWKQPVKEWVRELHAKKFGSRAASHPARALPPLHQPSESDDDDDDTEIPF